MDDQLSQIIPFAPAIPADGIVPLGYDRGVFYYLSRATKQVHSISADQHTQKALMGMASIPHYWQRSKFASEKGNIFWDLAADWLMTSCREMGVYNPERVRGRGAWFDDGRAVLHLGDRLLVDGAERPLLLPGSNAIYEAAIPLAVLQAPALCAVEAHKLILVCQGLRWQKPISATLCAGWAVCALICGALKWRPSIWLTGAARSGKTWVQENVLAPIVGPVAVQFQSKTTEAGVRQTLNNDALPIVFDEFEKEDQAAAGRVQGVLDLMRQGSSETEKKIAKGSQNQTRAKTYRIRSCFAFSSINVGLSHGADESRVTVLTLLPPEQANAEADERFRRLALQAAAVTTPEFAAGLLARSVGLLGVIRENADTFATAVALKLGTRRLGDQLGALLAGAYSLHSDRLITLEAAAEYLDRQDWGDALDSDAVRDETKLVSQITAARVRLAPGQGPAMELTIGRLIAATFTPDVHVSRDTAEGELRDYGIRTEPRGIWVSNNHPALAKLLIGTPWASGWARALARLTGADAGKKALRFGLGHVSKAVWVPIETLDQIGS